MDDVVAQGLRFAYGRTPVFDGVDATFAAGAVTAIVGGNGSGKSTLLLVLAGVVRAAGGTVRPRGRSTSLLAQRTEHIDGLPLTVRDCVRIGRYAQVPFWRPLGRGDRMAVDAAIDRVGMTEQRDARMRDLSGGQRQRAMIAQALVQRADVYLLDEPSTALDAAGRQVLRSLLREKAAAGSAVVVATHHPDEIAWADAVLDLEGLSAARGGQP